MTRLSELGESHVLSRILRHNRSGAQVIVGPGDDAAVTAMRGNLVSTADMLVENQDFTRDWLDWNRLGIKAAAQNLADVCAMGAEPHGLLVSLAVPDATEIADLEALFSGIVTEATRAGDELGCEVPIIGGDLSSSELIVVAITALGTVTADTEAGESGTGATRVAEASAPGTEATRTTGGAVTRAGAEPGDLVYLAGTVGRAAAGLDLLFAGERDDEALASLIRTQLSPQPDYSAIPAIRPVASAMIDVSDGLSTDLRRVAEASSVHIRIERERLQPLIDDLLPAARRLLALRETGDAEALALKWVLGGGEDHGFLAAAPASAAPPVGWRRIGEVTAGSGVSLDGEEVPTSGFSHFGK
ncbi:thiamine-monophosphate kinase [Brevibacterium sp.]|uniref:thiamine-phosphate kinase n=1 Tax=Brevibacterium sp. TaxID=1701 RepID=UPI002810AF50|nr:thiamine-monophosphate kinase [Brevibacterium sp.]